MKVIIILLLIMLSLYGDNDCDYIKNENTNLLKTDEKDVYCIYKTIAENIQNNLPQKISSMAQLVNVESNKKNEIHYYNIIDSNGFDIFISGIDVIKSDTQNNICNSPLMSHTFKNGGTLIYHYINSNDYQDFITIKINSCK